MARRFGGASAKLRRIPAFGVVSAANLTVRTNGGSTLLDLNGNTVMTLAGVTLPGNSIQFI